MIGAVVVTRLVRRRIFGLEPEEIAELLQTRDAMLHGVREGVVALDSRGRLALVNDEAMRLLDLSHDPSGRPAAEVLEAHDLLPLAVSPEDLSRPAGARRVSDCWSSTAAQPGWVTARSGG